MYKYGQFFHLNKLIIRDIFILTQPISKNLVNSLHGNKASDLFYGTLVYLYVFYIN